MIEPLIASRYCHALFSIDRETDAFSRRLDDFNSILGLLKANPNLMRILRAPHISLVEKKKLLSSLDGICSLASISFIDHLVETKRIVYLLEIAQRYLSKVNDYFHTLNAHVVSAVPLSQDISDRLKCKFEQYFGKSIVLTQTVDKKIIGGLVFYHQRSQSVNLDRVKAPEGGDCQPVGSRSNFENGRGIVAANTMIDWSIASRLNRIKQSLMTSSV